MYSVVVLDDEKLICEEIRSILEAGVPELLQITVFHDGQEACDYLSTHRADILLLDIEVPGKTGLEIARMVRARHADSCIFIITAYRDFEYAQQAIRCSVNGFLTKPFSSGQLIGAVRDAISRFEEKTSSEEDRRRADRSLLLSLCQAGTAPKGYGDICFCRRSIPLKRLTCTEITFTDTGFDSVPAQLLSNLEEMLIRAAENDCETQTSLLLEQTTEQIRVLVLSEGAPDLGFLAGFAAAIAAQTGSSPVYTRRTYDSFVSYREQLSFEREMNVFFDLLSDGATSQAKKHLVRHLRALTPEQLRAFSEFLSRDYGVEAAPDEDSIQQALDRIIQEHLSRDTGNYIVEAAKRYMQQNFAVSSLSLRSVAEELYVSSAYLSRLFKKHNDANFSDYLLKLRMERARELLGETNLPTIAIASAVGYENVSYFRMSFKGYFGMTPSQYRQIHHNRRDVEEP